MTTLGSIGIRTTQDNAQTLNGAMGHIRGKVIDLNNNGLFRCKIWIRETGQHTYSDKIGNFILINIAPAIHTIIVEHKGYSLSTYRDLPIKAGDNPDFRFVMHAYPVFKEYFSNFNLVDFLFNNKENSYGINTGS
jgi:hypothetical protein